MPLVAPTWARFAELPSTFPVVEYAAANRINIQLMKRTVFLIAVLLASSAAHALEWRDLVSTPERRSMLDLDSVIDAQGFQRFMIRRAYTTGHALPTGQTYHSSRLHFIADCKTGKALAAVTVYYGEDRKMVHTENQAQVKRSELVTPEPGSDIAEGLEISCQRVAEGLAKKPEAKPPAKPVARAPSTSGSGIVIGEDGRVLTNNHVVQQCNSYQVIDAANNVLSAKLLATDAVNDLALLGVEKRYATIASVRADASPKLGESIVVVGYPLASLLGTSPTVGFGHVSSTTGIRNNKGQMQISVPVQRGNSGGPVFDQSGNVIGVVTSKLDAFKIHERTGDLPQNVNFAVRGDVMRGFLEYNRVNFSAARGGKLENTEIASHGAAVTVRVRCLRGPATVPAGAAG
jgi:S1-C subfamily serine protease